MAKTINPLDELKRIVQEAGNQRAAADRLGISQPYLCDLLLSRRTFSSNMLAKMNLTKHETITRVKA